MGYVRNERGMKQALDSLARIEALKDDLIADNWHELMRTHEALVLLEMCKLVTWPALNTGRHPTAPFICVPTTPIPIPALNRLMVTEKGGWPAQDFPGSEHEVIFS